ncbi:MAG: hypothetical protein R2747_00515 [Pyrinomonadaceae bacterium]
MLKKLSAIAIILLSFTLTRAQNEETEPAGRSNLTGINLPGGTLRVRDGSVPVEISEGLEKLVAEGGGKIVQGEKEILAWMDAGYKKANAANLLSQIEANLEKAGWTFEVSGKEGEVTVFSVIRETPAPRALLGYLVVSDEAMVLAWTEIHAAGSAGPVGNDTVGDDAGSVSTPVSSGSRGGAIVGTWTNGGMSMIGEKDLNTGSVTPRNGSTFKYVFHSDGSFEFVGLVQSTMSGCTTGLFNDKRGRYEIDGLRLTLIPSKNFWRNTYSCSPQSNKERNYLLDRETYQFRTKTDEYGATLVCLTNAKGEESCYRREKQ